MKIPKKIDERRRSIRIEESLPFRLGNEEYGIEAVTINVSSHGAMCLVEKDVPLMTQFQLALTLPEASGKDRAVHAVGVVVRKDVDPMSGKHAIALFFSEIKPKDQKILDEFIQRRLRA